MRGLVSVPHTVVLGNRRQAGTEKRRPFGIDPGRLSHFRSRSFRKSHASSPQLVQGRVAVSFPLWAIKSHGLRAQLSALGGGRSSLIERITNPRGQLALGYWLLENIQTWIESPVAGDCISRIAGHVNYF